MFEWLANGSSNGADIGQLIYRFTPGQIDAFAYGALIPLFGFNRTFNNVQRWFVFGWGLFLIAGVTNAILLQSSGEAINWFSLGYENGDTRNYQYIWTYIVVNIAAAPTILYLLHCRSRIASLFESGGAVLIGKVSYGMYVYHWPLRSFHLKFIDPHIPVSAISFAVYFLLVLLVSYASFHFVESRILKLKDYKLRTA
jgi:peptidoglycan/LPS O-acetylase OafA/YrhL